MLASLARFAPAVLGKVADLFVPGSGEAVQKIAEQGKKWYADKRTAEEKAEILKALRITEEKLNAFDRMFILLGRDCLQLLERVAALEAQGQDSADEIARAVLAAPELQERFDSLGLAVSLLEADVRRLDDGFARLSDFAHELKAKQLTDTELADFRAFRRAKQFQAAGNFAESEPILLKLAGSQPQSAAVAVALAVAQHDRPPDFDASVKKAVRLKPDDANLRALASAATVAVTGRHTPAARPAPPVGRVPKLGDTLDGWALEQRLGGGGWGIVFRATKRGQTKALKVMRPDLTDHAEFVEAFHEEALKLNRLRHANVVAVERIGFCRDFQCPYFVMPLLDGLTLEAHLDRHGVPSAGTAMGWLTGLLDGLEHAHSHGLIHRDVKPANVIVQPDGAAVLIDFGIAGLDGVAGHTQALGMSRQFAPPEQLSAGTADLRADLYSLAATIFYALRYDHPTERLAHEYEAEFVPEPFRAAFDAALSRKPSKRPASAVEMRAMLPIVKIKATQIQVARPSLPAAVEEQPVSESSVPVFPVERAALTRVAKRLAKHLGDHVYPDAVLARIVQLEAMPYSERLKEAEAVKKSVVEGTKKVPVGIGRRVFVAMMAGFNTHIDAQRVKQIAERGVPELIEAVDKQELALGPAVDLLDLPKAEQVEAVKSGKAVAAASETRRRRKKPFKGTPQPETDLDGSSPPANDEEKSPTSAEIASPNPVTAVRKAGDQTTILLPGNVPMTFAWCPPGTFRMGSPASETGRRDDEQQHEVTLTKGFWMGIHPVTQAQYQAAMGSNPSHFKGDTLPVEQVSWDDTQAFCAALKRKGGVELRLPTEAEWEYAARGGTTTPFYWGDQLNGAQANCNGKRPYGTSVKGPFRQETTPVGSRAAQFQHPWGLCDVIGNVWEWCADWYDAEFYANCSADDPECCDSKQKYRVLRGGSWFSDACGCRVARRFCYEQTGRGKDFGFRLAADESALAPAG